MDAGGERTEAEVAEADERGNEPLPVRQDIIDVLFQLDIAALFRVVDDRGAGRLRAELEPLENGAVLLGVVPFPLGALGFLLPEGVFQKFCV